MADKITEIDRVWHAVILAADGLPIGKSQTLKHEQAERTAAGSSGLMALGQDFATTFGSEPTVHQVMVEFEGGFVFLCGAGNGTRLVVITASDVDPALIGSEMQRWVKQLGKETLSTPARSTDRP